MLEYVPCRNGLSLAQHKAADRKAMRDNWGQGRSGQSGKPAGSSCARNLSSAAFATPVGGSVGHCRRKPMKRRTAQYPHASQYQTPQSFRKLGACDSWIMAGRPLQVVASHSHPPFTVVGCEQQALHFYSTGNCSSSLANAC